MWISHDHNLPVSHSSKKHDPPYQLLGPQSSEANTTSTLYVCMTMMLALLTVRN
jgi:hypothetical protein